MTPKVAISDIRRKKKVDFFGGGKGWNKEFREIKEFKEIKGFREFSSLFITLTSLIPLNPLNALTSLCAIVISALPPPNLESEGLQMWT